MSMIGINAAAALENVSREICRIAANCCAWFALTSACSTCQCVFMKQGEHSSSQWSEEEQNKVEEKF